VVRASPTSAATAALVSFVGALRQEGLVVPVGATVVFARAVAAVGSTDRSSLYWAGRATLITRPEEVATFDRVFRTFWGDAPRTPAPGGPIEVRLLLDDDTDQPEEPAPDATVSPEGEDGQVISVRFSPREVLRDKDFAAYTPDELVEARRLMAQLRLSGSERRSRRHRPSSAGRGRPDLRATMRQAVRTGGEPRRLHRLAPGTRPRRVVLLCDVSGSMEPYSRALLHFAHSAVVARRGVEAFALGTRLTRLTRELSSHDPDAAVAAASAAVADWSGGTRLGDGLARFNDEWGVPGMARGAVVVILSDGWDRGDPDRLAEQMARLSRVAHRLVWVNPLKATPDYQPLARGMAAALPYVDEFVAGHSLASLQDLAEVIGAH
jgi:uncharacterized protein